MPLFNNVLAGAAGSGGDAFMIERSLRFNSGDSAILDRTFSTEGDRKTWTWSGWVKLSKLGTTRRFWGVAGSSDTTLVDCRFETTDKLIIAVSSTQWRTTTQVFRDCSSFYHIVFAVDTRQSTANDRVKVYINGSQITDFDVTNNPSQNSDTGINQAAVHRVGSGYIASNSFDGLIANVQFVDGQQLAPADFGEFDAVTGVWKPSKYTGTYGNNGFKLLFDPVAGLGKDSHGGVSAKITTSNITAASTSSVSLGGSSTGGASTSQSEVANAFDNNTSTLFGYTGGGNTPALIKEWTFSTGLPVKAGDVISYEGTKGAGFKAGVFLANGQVVGGNYPYPNVDSVTASSDTTITKINAGSFGGGNQYSNIKKLTINGVAYPLSPTELTLTDTTGLSDLNIEDTINQTGGSATGVIYRISGSTVDLTQTTNTWGTGTTAEKPSAPIENDFNVSNLTTSVQSVQSSAITAVATVNTWNQAKVWSNEVSGPRQGSNPWSNAFDGSINSNVDVNGSTSLNQSFTGVTSFRFATVINQPVTISGTGITTQTWSTAGWKSVTLTSTSISNIVVSPGPGESLTYPSAFEVNGEILVDQGVSGNQVVSNTLTLTDTTNLDALSVGDVVYPGNKQITAINTSTPSIVVNGGAFQVGGVVSKLGTFGDDVIDSPSNEELEPGDTSNPIGNYCTLNLLNKSDTATISNGGLSIVDNVDSDQTTGTIAVSSGKYYFEATITTYSGTQQDGLVGISDVYRTNFEEYVGKGPYSYGIAIAEYNTYMKKYNGNTAVDTDLTPPVLGDIVGVAFDLDNGKIYFHKNGVYANGGNPATGSNPAYAGISGMFAPAITCSGSTGGTVGWDFNFGQRGSFDFAVPTGFKTLCTANLSASVRPSEHFQAKLYSGNGGTNTISGLPFSPDWSWLKKRSSTSSHSLHDTVRGATKRLRTESQDAETNEPTALTAFTSDGFTLGSGGTANANNAQFVSWNWNAGSNSNKTYVVTVVSDSGNKYRFDGHGTSSVTLDLAEGSTYIFDQSHSSNAGHPIRFGTSANGTDYTTGVTHVGTPGSAGAKTTLVLGTGVSTLYYSCQNHSGMGGQINTNSTAGCTHLSGSQNATAYDQSQTWSSTSNLSGSYRPSNNQYGPQNMFNGIIANESTTGGVCFSAFTSNSSMTWTSPVTYNNLTSLRLWVDKSGTGTGFLRVNGNNYDSLVTDGYVTIPETSLSTIQFGYTGGTNTATGVGGVEVNGILLIDSGATVSPVPSINSIVKANQDAGFSIVSFENGSGTVTIAHGLTVGAPEWIITKSRDSNNSWQVYHVGLGNSKKIFMNGASQAVNSVMWGNTNPTNGIFTLDDGATNSWIAYCFAPIENYSKFGSFEGNGSANGPFIWTGFKPAAVFIRLTEGAGSHWKLYDNKRDIDNPIVKQLYPSADYSEPGDDVRCDFLSNGFKIRTAGSEDNYNNNTLIYCAFAENPFSDNGGLAR